jgi:hypothetical protein
MNRLIPLLVLGTGCALLAVHTPPVALAFLVSVLVWFVTVVFCSTDGRSGDGRGREF